jgi:hypothetical protein
MERRLGHLETIWPAPEPVKCGTSPEEREWISLGTPALYWALLDAAEDRGRRRLLEPGRPAQVAWDAWHRLGASERRDRQVREVEALDALVHDLGPAVGLETWIREAVSIGLMFREETADYVWRSFQSRYAYGRGSLDRARAKHPTWATEHPDWWPEMPTEDFFAFEWGLLDRLSELWAAERGGT